MYESYYYYPSYPDRSSYYGDPSMQQINSSYHPYGDINLNYPTYEGVPYQTPYEQVPFQTPFAQYAKPKQPDNWYQIMQSTNEFNQQAFPNQFNQAQQMNQTNPVNQPVSNNQVASNQNPKGQMDLDKMLTTVGQIANTYHQVAPIVKQFGSFMKIFR